jgi:hypothetical protein
MAVDVTLARPAVNSSLVSSSFSLAPLNGAKAGETATIVFDKPLVIDN